MSSCRSCGAEGIWALTEKGKSVLIDAIPDDKGNLVLICRGVDPMTPPLAVHVSHVLKSTLELSCRFVVHFVRCPDAEKWRRGNAKPDRPPGSV